MNVPRFHEGRIADKLWKWAGLTRCTFEVGAARGFEQSR
jgi:hypothetical protein